MTDGCMGQEYDGREKESIVFKNNKWFAKNVYAEWFPICLGFNWQYK